MTSEDDTFFEEEDYDEEEEDEEEEEEDEEDDFPDADEDEYDGYDDYAIDGPSRLTKFADDPWPTTTFLLMVIGFGVVFAPSVFWAGANRYFLLAGYVLLILCGVAISYSLVTWEKARGSRLRWAGMTNFIVVILCAVIGIADTINWVVNTQSIIPGITTPLISLIMVLVVFSIYTLWIVQKNFSGPRR
ncbi:MAG: hypothetical protein ACFFF9_04020 [Candidatus Thorarchaeota archaeon]